MLRFILATLIILVIRAGDTCHEGANGSGWQCCDESDTTCESSVNYCDTECTEAAAECVVDECTISPCTDTLSASGS